MNMFQTYLWLKLDAIQNALECIGIIGSTFTIVLTLAFSIENKKMLYGLFLLILFLPMIILGMLMPNTKQFAVMYILPKITNEETLNTVKTESFDIYKMAKKYLENKLKED